MVRLIIKKKMQPKILIIDDDRDIVEALKIILEGESYRVKVAFDGQTGFKAIQEEKPDLVILDLLLPGQNGVAIYRNLKAHLEYRDIPVLVLTALAKKMGDRIFSQKEETLLKGVDGYLDKPVNPRRLLDRVKKLLGEKSEEGN